MWTYITELGDLYFALLVISLLLWSGKRRLGIGLSLVMVFDLFLNAGLKSFFHAPRPPGANRASYSFPSGHTQRISAITGYLREPWFLIFVLFVAYSRLALGVHYWQDVVAGAIIGLLEGYLLWKLWKKIPLKLEIRFHKYLFALAIIFSFIGIFLAIQNFPYLYLLGASIGLATGLTLHEHVKVKTTSNYAIGLAGFALILYFAYDSNGLQAYFLNYLLGFWVSYLSIKTMNVFNTSDSHA